MKGRNAIWRRTDDQTHLREQPLVRKIKSAAKHLVRIGKVKTYSAGLNEIAFRIGYKSYDHMVEMTMRQPQSFINKKSKIENIVNKIRKTKQYEVENGQQRGPKHRTENDFTRQIGI
jgi:hypothetical protein